MLKKLLNDEAGFIVSAELVLIATILVIGLIVGLSEVQHAVVSELNDVADAIGNLNQSYMYTGFSKDKSFGGGVASYTRGSAWLDSTDECDDNQCDIACDLPVDEGPKNGGGGGGAVGGTSGGGGTGGTSGTTTSGNAGGTSAVGGAVNGGNAGGGFTLGL